MESTNQELLMSLVAAQNDAIIAFKLSNRLLEQRISVVENAFNNMKNQAEQLAQVANTMKAENAELQAKLDLQKDNMVEELL